MTATSGYEIVRVSASQADRVVRCVASAALPQVTDDNDSEARDRGHAVHKFLERVPEVGHEAALAETDEAHRDLCSSINLARLADKLAMSREVALAYNWVDDTARLAGRDAAGRLLLDRSCEVGVIADVLGHDQAARSVYVGDYKTGRSWLPAPEHSQQLGLGALAAARFLKARSARVEYMRIRDDGTVHRFSAEIDAMMLDAAADKIASTMRRALELRALVLAGHVPNVVEGEWCRYCPAKAHCPAKTAIIRRVVSDASPIDFVTPLTMEGARRAYLQLRAAKAAVAAVESALFAFAKLTPIHVETEEDGTERWFGEWTREGNDVLDGAVVHKVLTEEFGGDAANKAVTMEATKKALGTVVRAHLKEGEKISKRTDEVIAKVRAAGGVSNPVTTTTVEHTVGPDGTKKKGR